jgi:hypothetical protein
MAKFALRATMLKDPTTGKDVLGIAKTNRRGETVVTIAAGVDAMPEAQAVQFLKAGQIAGSNAYQATMSIIAPNVGFIMAGIDIAEKGPDDTKKAISKAIAALLKSKGVDAEGRGNPVGPYRSVAAAYLAAGGKLEIVNGKLPPEKSIRVGKVLEDEEVYQGFVDRFLTLMDSVEKATEGAYPLAMGRFLEMVKVQCNVDINLPEPVVARTAGNDESAAEKTPTNAIGEAIPGAGNQQQAAD